MSIVQRTKTYAVCPHCGEDAGCIDHLLGTVTRTAWHCDSCGKRYELKFSEDGAVQIDIVPGRLVKTVDVLVLKPQKKPIYFAVDGIRFEDEGRDDRSEAEHKQFYYEEHSCPINWLKPTLMYLDGDDDPHGVIEFVATRDADTFPPDESYGPNPHDEEVIAFIESSDRKLNEPK